MYIVYSWTSSRLSAASSPIRNPVLNSKSNPRLRISIFSTKYVSILSFSSTPYTWSIGFFATFLNLFGEISISDNSSAILNVINFFFFAYLKIPYKTVLKLVNCFAVISCFAMHLSIKSSINSSCIPLISTSLISAKYLSKSIVYLSIVCFETSLLVSFQLDQRWKISSTVTFSSFSARSS